jgi:hypothetical protein
MIRKIVIAALCLASAPLLAAAIWIGVGAAVGQAVGGNGVPGANSSGGSGFPITLGSTSIGANSTITKINGLLGLNNVALLSSSSDIGAQINTAQAAMSGTGVIVLPNSTTIPMSTTATNIPPGITIHGYGKLGSIVDCTVAGDCLQFFMNPTTAGEIGSEIDNFGIIGSGASSQVLMHFNGANGYTLHDLQFEPYAGSGNAAVCLEFDNSANNLFTEDNRTYNVELERQCTTGVLFNQAVGVNDTSFGYNIFEFRVISAGSNFGLVFNGPGVLYGGSLTVFGNHVSTNTGGGIMQFNNGFSTGSSSATGDQTINISAEENGSGSGIMIAATGTNTLRFTGNIVNGAGGAPSLATIYSIGGSASLQHNEIGFASSTLAYLSQSTKPIAVEWNNAGAVTLPSGNLSVTGGGIVVGGSSFTPSANMIQATGNWTFGTSFGLSNTSSGGLPWAFVSEGSGVWGGAFYMNNGTAAPLTLFDNNSAAPWLGVLPTEEIAWSPTSTFPTSTAQNAGLGSPASGVVTVDGTTAGDFGGRLKLGAITMAGGTVPTITGCGTITAQSGGNSAGTFTTSTTGTCTAVIPLPPIAHGYTCEAHDITQHAAANDLRQSATSASSCTVTGTTAASDVITFVAFGW